MKSKIIISVVILVACFNRVNAQKKISFSSQNYLGVLMGENIAKPQLQTINGVKINKWFAGIGTGIDWYYQRSVPVFASFSRSFLPKGKRSFLASADLGVNFPWSDENQYYYYYESGNQEKQSGLYWATGIGYKLGLGKSDNALLVQLGYSFKQQSEKYKSVYPCLIAPCPEDVVTYDYKLKRLSIKIGWGF